MIRLFSAVAGFLVVTVVSCEIGVASQRPNVLLILTDDQGYGDICSHGNSQIDTPVLDRLAEQGTRLDRFLVSPLCAPTRASLLTGRDFLRTGTTWVTHRWEVMRSEEFTIAEVLGAAGYATGCIGKWHNGRQFPNHPLGQGFDEFFGMLGGGIQYYFDAPLYEGYKSVQTKGYITDVLTDAALRFVERHRDEPFFCYLPYNAPHSPFIVPDRYYDKYRKRGLDETTAAVYGMVENVDENVGRILRRLDDLDLTDNTIVVFLTDNGPNGKRYNDGMKGKKGSVDEGGVRVPCFLRWPGHIPAAKTVTQITAHIDLLPTLAELCSVPLSESPPLDGKSIVPLIMDATPDWPDRMIFSHNPRRGQPALAPGSVRTARWRLVRKTNSYELYDMQADPGQQQNVAAQHADVVRRLGAAYEGHFAEIASTGFRRPLIPVGHPEMLKVEVPAPSSYYEGGMGFANGPGWTTDWMIGWHTPEDRIWWELAVARGGRYEILIRYACDENNIGSKLRITADGRTLDSVLSEPFDTGVRRRPERTPESKRTIREFALARLGEMVLPKGKVRLELRAVEVPAGMVCELRGLVLRRSD